MKCLKNVLIVMIVCTITPLIAKVMKQKVTTTVQPKPAPVIHEPVTIQPIIQPIQPIILPRPIPIPMIQPVKKVFLVSTNENVLKNLELCPLFGKNGGLYFVFNPKARLFSGEIVARFEGEDVAQNAPCVVPLGTFGNWNRTLMQLKTLDQFELADKTGFSPAMCGGLSLNNGRLIRNYAYTGNQENLRALHDIGDATNFLLDLKIGDWLNAQVLRDNLKKLGVELGIDGVDVSAVSTVSLFDSNLNTKFGFGIFDEDEFAYVQKVKKNIQEGFKKDNYIHIMIIGNEETVEAALGHYFCFAIIKTGNHIEYVVLDTIPSAYHLQQGSHERNRLMFVIQNIEQGYSSINVANIRVKRLQLLEEERVAGTKMKSLR
jgi:hypothetical protein